MPIHSTVEGLVKGMEGTLDRYITRVNRQVGTVARELKDLIVARTPEDTGQTASSWILSTAEPPTMVQPPGSYPNPLHASKSMDSIAPAKGGFPAYYISNFIPWVHKLEFGLYAVPGGSRTINGFSTQAPRGMVRISLIEIYEKWNSGGFKF